MLTEADIRRLARLESIADGFEDVSTSASSCHVRAIVAGLRARQDIGVVHREAMQGPFDTVFCFDSARYPVVTNGIEEVTRDYQGICVYFSLLSPYAAWGEFGFFEADHKPPRRGGVANVPGVAASTAMGIPECPDKVGAALLAEIGRSPYALVSPDLLTRSLPPDLTRPEDHCPIDRWETWFDAVFFMYDL